MIKSCQNEEIIRESIQHFLCPGIGLILLQKTSHFTLGTTTDRSTNMGMRNKGIPLWQNKSLKGFQFCREQINFPFYPIGEIFQLRGIPIFLPIINWVKTKSRLKERLIVALKIGLKPKQFPF